MESIETEDLDPMGELADTERLVKAACKLVEYAFEDGDDNEQAILGVLYAALDKIKATDKAIKLGMVGKMCTPPAPK